MNLSSPLRVIATLFVIAATGLGCEQNTKWTVERDPSLPTYRVVAYGDSIFSGLYAKEGHASPYEYDTENVARRAAPYVAGEYLGRKWNANIRVVRRAKAGGTAAEVYNKIVADDSYMQFANTRVVMFEMCGTDYLKARESFKDQSDTCNYVDLETALSDCRTYMERAMQPTFRTSRSCFRTDFKCGSIRAGLK